MMLISDDPIEDSRLAALYRYDVLDTPPEASFDRITRIAKAVMNTPIVLISLVDRDRQWFKSRIGVSACETSLTSSFCVHAIQSDVPLIVTDALQDPRFRTHPAVVQEPRVRFYLGVPLRTPGGHNIGTICAADTQPRELEPSHLAVMEDLSWLTVDQLELRQIATTDSLTSALTRRSFIIDARIAFQRSRSDGRKLCCVMLDVDHFKRINDCYGHAAGDHVLREITNQIRSVLRSADCLGRIGGEEFAILLPETSLAGGRMIAERVRERIAAAEFTLIDGSRLTVTVSQGVAALGPTDCTFETILKRADDALYRAKAAGRNCVVMQAG